MTDSILVAADGGEYAARALRRAIDVAKDTGSRLYVLAVVDERIHGEVGLSSEELVTVETEDRYTDFLDYAIGEAAAADVDCHCECQHGIPHERILEYADDVDADVIFIGVEGDHADHVGGVGRKVQAESSRDVHVVGDDGGSE